MFISQAFAEAVETTGAVGGMDSFTKPLFQFTLILVIFYFLLIRPQKKKMDEQEKTLKSIDRGDKIIVAGIVGSVSKIVGDNELIVEIADDVKITVLRNKVQGLYENEVASSKKDAANNNDKSKKKANASKLKEALSNKEK